MAIPVKTEKEVELVEKTPEMENVEHEIHEIDTETKPQLEMISEEHFQMICNPAGHAFKAALDAFEKDQNTETLEQIYSILLINGADCNSQVHSQLPRLIPYLANNEFYDTIALMLSDIAHLNEAIVNILLELDVFAKLDYKKSISFSLILSICDSNKKAWNIFKKAHFKPEFKDIQSIQILINNNKSENKLI
ncbi:hypothetical protein GINT2_002314 [Glugoides intestinalis]